MQISIRKVYRDCKEKKILLASSPPPLAYQGSWLPPVGVLTYFLVCLLNGNVFLYSQFVLIREQYKHSLISKKTIGSVQE